MIRGLSRVLASTVSVGARPGWGQRPPVAEAGTASALRHARRSRRARRGSRLPEVFIRRQ